MDVDLSTDLNALFPLLAPLLSGHSDVAIGTRLARGARVVRGPRREAISRCYNLLLHATLGTGFSDAQCGFKAIRADAARALLPLTTDTGWFFDTELLVLAEKAGLRIHEVPVDWIDDLDSRVAIAKTVGDDLWGIARLMRSRVDLEPVRQKDGPPRMLDPRNAFAARGLRFCAFGVLTVASLAATVVRFSLFQTWVFDDDAPNLPAFEPPAVLDQTRSN